MIPYTKNGKQKKNTKITNNIEVTAPYPDEDHWGDKLGPKRNNDIRISMENINNIGRNAEKNPKQEFLNEWLINHEIDVASWIEIGIAWNKLRYKDRLLRRMRFQEWQNPKMVTSNNKHKFSNSIF